MGKIDKIRKFWDDRNNQVKYCKWLIKYTKPYTGKLALLLFLGLFSTATTLIMAVISKELIDSATGGSKERVIRIIFIYIAFIIATQVFEVITSLVKTMLNEKFSFGIRKQVYDKILTSSWIQVQKYHTGDLMTRLTSDAGAIADGIINTITDIISLTFEFIMVFFTLFIYSPWLAVFAVLIAPIGMIISVWFGRKLKTLQIKVQESEATYRSFLQESIANLLIVKAFANEEYASKRLVNLRDERFLWVFKKTKLGVVSSNVMAVSFQLGYITAFTYGALQVADGLITYGTMSIFLTLVNQIQAPIMQLAHQIPKIVAILASAGRVMDIQNMQTEDYTDMGIQYNRIGINVKNLEFGYTNEKVLENISFMIKEGEMVAIIGESGIGKTTLIRLIMSFLIAERGEILFYGQDGVPKKVNASCRKFIAYVPQGNTLFSGTIRENIRMGCLQASEEEILSALKLTSAYDFVRELPDGIDTIIGERGHGLSEGQAQRIALARAIVRKAPVLILDEATSALDEQTELNVLKGINSLEPKPTCIVITHRKSILKYCNRELVIVNKHINENDHKA